MVLLSKLSSNQFIIEQREQKLGHHTGLLLKQISKIRRISSLAFAVLNILTKILF